LFLEFRGPSGVAFPQQRPDVDGFDDATRKGAALSSEALKQSITSPALNEYADYKPEFTDEEIRAAFNFIDLDHNNYVGAAEIRHILVCMGELITDEEIDMMISMIDYDGDGQVSFTEFKFLVCHPNPGEADLVRELALAKQIEMQTQEKELSVASKAKGQSDGVDFATHRRQKEMLNKEEKRKALTGFVEENEIRLEDIQVVYAKYSAVNIQQLLNGSCTFDLFCALFKVEPISEYKYLFGLFDDEEVQRVNMKELLLSLLNFVEVEKETRIKFSFEMYDERRTNFISLTEIELILKGNHMCSLASVLKKAETIMRQASTNSQGFITLNEFQAIAKKFPNVLFPVFQTDKVQAKSPAKLGVPRLAL
jgi:Ca2+-binding EF-hand superfamily protein